MFLYAQLTEEHMASSDGNFQAAIVGEDADYNRLIRVIMVHYVWGRLRGDASIVVKHYITAKDLLAGQKSLPPRQQAQLVVAALSHDHDAIWLYDQLAQELLFPIFLLISERAETEFAQAVRAYAAQSVGYQEYADTLLTDVLSAYREGAVTYMHFEDLPSIREWLGQRIAKHLLDNAALACYP